MGYLMFTAIVMAIIGAVNCSTDADCPDQSTCSEGACFCNQGHFLNTANPNALPYVTEYNGECSEDAQCEWLGENSVCKYACRCKDGYRWYLGQCRKYVGLGGDCTDTIDCFDGYNLQSLTCDNNKCVCSTGYYSRGDTDCRKIASKENDICAMDIDCQVPEVETVCHIGKCIKTTSLKESENFEYLEEVEEKSILNLKISAGETACETDEDCANITNSECYDKTKTCICKQQYFFNENNNQCIPELGVNVACTQDSDCPIKPGKCDNNGVCYCRDYYFVADGNRKCVKTISQNNWNCLSKEWCYALGSYVYCASSGTCECSHIAKLDNETELCIKERDPDPDMCFTDLDCKSMTNTYCIDEVCSCKDNNIFQDNRCVPDLGASCDGTVPCAKNNSRCQNGICQCVENYVIYEKDNNKTCYEKRDRLGDECEVDVQCSVGVTYSECLNGKCVCNGKHTPYGNKCYQKTEYGSYCNNRRECILSLNETIGDSIQCRNQKCQCPTGYTKNGNQCSSGRMIAGNFILVATALKIAFQVFT